MKVLINGCSIGEIVEAKISKKDVVVLSDTVAITEAHVNLFDRVIGHIKKNKSMYIKLVILIAMTIDQGTLTVLASSKLEEGLTVLTDKLVGILILFAKTGCLGMGLKEMVICLLNGGNIKEASVSGLGYWIGYIFLQLYPYLYELVEGLTF